MKMFLFQAQSVIILGILCILTACTTKMVKCTDPTDTPQQHYLSGMKSIDEGKLDVAGQKFDRALYCDAEFSKGYAGQGIVSGEKVKLQTDAGFRAVEAGRVDEALGKSLSFVKTPDDNFDYQLARIRTLTAVKPEGWLVAAENAQQDALSLKMEEPSLIYYQGSEAVSYFMGLAYLEALELGKARDSFAAVLKAKKDGKWHEKADRAWKRTEKIVRAMAGVTVGDLGKKIAVKDSISRLDLAVLLVEDLKIDKLMAGRLPASAADVAAQTEFVPADITGQPLQKEVSAILNCKIRGLEPKFDQSSQAYLFMPADSVSRGELAFVLEDILMKILGNDKLSTAYYSQDNSPFKDIRPSSPVFNAAITMTSRSIMDGEVNGEFRPNAPVSGADALLAIRILQQNLNIY